jgi:hypothetical protein
VAYLSQRLVDAEITYSSIENYVYAYSMHAELKHYLLASPCTVSYQTDVIKYMLQNPIMIGRIGKWAYALI